jgi:hypothetical protein
MSAYKELDFFVRREDSLLSTGNWHRGEDWYRAWFSDRYGIRGESSPHYSVYPLARGVPERVAQVVPGARILYCVRDPIDRVVSHYVSARARGEELRDINEVLAAVEDDPDNTYVARSRYATQLERWLDHLPSERVRVIALDDLHADPAESIRRVLEFLEIDDSVDLSTIRNPNPSDARPVPHPLAVRAERLGLRRAAQRTLPPRARALARAAWMRITARPIDRPELSAERREALVAVLKPEADRLRELTGQSFASWSV